METWLGWFHDEARAELEARQRAFAARFLETREAKLRYRELVVKHTPVVVTSQRRRRPRPSATSPNPEGNRRQRRKAAALARRGIGH